MWKSSEPRRTDDAETEGRIPKERTMARRLGGWGARIRTWEWRNQNPLAPPSGAGQPKSRATSPRTARRNAELHAATPPSGRQSAALHAVTLPYAEQRS